MTAEGIVNHEFSAEDSAMINSTRIRVGRNLADYPLGPGITKAQRDEIMNRVVEDEEDEEDDEDRSWRNEDNEDEDDEDDEDEIWNDDDEEDEILNDDDDLEDDDEDEIWDDDDEDDEED